MTADLIKSILGTAIRNAVAPAIVWLTAKGWITTDDANALIAAIIVSAASFIWGLIQKWRSHRALDKALELPAGTSRDALKYALKE